jgi:hypothetical protein
MANPHKGEVELKAGDATYVLRFGWNEIAEIEGLLDISFFEALAPKFQAPSSIRGGEWRALLWAALRGRQSQIDLLAAGEIINEVGLEAVITAIGRAFQLTFPDKEAAEENPPGASSSAGTMQ